MDNMSCADTNCSVPDEQELLLGVILLVCVTVVFVPLMLFGLVGNTLTILVFWLHPHMRSSTYLYLSSMAVSDLLILLLLPLYMVWIAFWTLGDFICKLTMFLSDCCMFCIILHITSLALERYLAVCWPITARVLLTRRRAVAVIGCLWLGAAVSAAPIWFMIQAEEVIGRNKTMCSMTGDTSGLRWAMIMLYILYFPVPLCIMGVLHILIRRALLRRPQSSCRDQSNRRTVKMLGIILLVDVLCLSPAHILALLTDFLPSLARKEFYIWLWLVSVVLFNLSASINPLLYNLMSARYRDAVRSLVRKCCHTPPCQQRTALTSEQTTNKCTRNNSRNAR